MDIRKCIYTNEPSTAKDSILPKKIAGQEVHNWSNHVPCSQEYKDFKKDRAPTELEMQAHEAFHNLEMAKIRVKYYENLLSEIQAKILKNKDFIEFKNRPRTDKKEEQIQKAIREHSLLQETEDKVNELIEQKKKLWE